MTYNCVYKLLSLFTSHCEIDPYQSLPHPTIPASCAWYWRIVCESACLYCWMLLWMCGSKYTAKCRILKLDFPLKSDFNPVSPQNWCCFAMLSSWCENHICVTMGVEIRFVWCSCLNPAWSCYGLPTLITSVSNYTPTSTNTAAEKSSEGERVLGKKSNVAW